MSHPIISDLEKRYTTKKYDPSKKVSDADLDVLLKAIHLSASSINSQPWKFLVLESQAAKEKFHQTFINKYQFNQPHALNASHIILFAHNPFYNKENYNKVIEQSIKDNRVSKDNRDKAFASFAFVELNSDEKGYNGNWTCRQIYCALGNALHTLARLKIQSTTMEGVDSELIGEAFKHELDGYICPLALAIGYSAETDYNMTLPKSRLPEKDIIIKL